jgi:hypothetical protein
MDSGGGHADSIARTIAHDNEVTAYHLVRQLRTPLGVIPFVGAGMSARFKFPQWAEVLRSGASVEGEEVSAAVDTKLAEGDFEAAAEILLKRSEDDFQRRIEQAYGRKLSEAEAREGPLTQLPWLVSGPVITTNFDHVVEDVFRVSGNPFADRILGREPDRILKAIHGNTRVLIKMHGDCEDRHARTFTKEEYEENYGDSRVGLGSLLRLMFTSRPLLFLGCSLDKDRTVGILRQLHSELGALTHYAIVAAERTEDAFRGKRQALRDLGIAPLWFPPGEFDKIETILAELVFGMSVRALPGTQRVAPTMLQSSPTRGNSGASSSSLVLPGSTPRTEGTFDSSDDVPLPSDVVRSRSGHLEWVADTVLAGRVTFVFGVGAHLGAFDLAAEFYEALASRFGCPPQLGTERSAIARHIADRFGRRILWEATREVLSKRVHPSVVHNFVAGLPGLLRKHGRGAVASQFIISTNQDSVLERALEEAGEPFHVFYYCSDGEHEGLFIHRDPSGDARIIDRPANIRRLSDATVLVKLNGGIVYPDASAWPESVAIARGDYAKLASRIPAALPEVVCRAIADRSLLFLGHGLNELDVEELVRFSSGPTRIMRSWAIQHPARNADYWAHCGLEVRDCDLTDYIPSLERVISRRLDGDDGFRP